MVASSYFKPHTLHFKLGRRPFVPNKACAKQSWRHPAGSNLPGQRIADRPE